ncbi:hypothetical protein ACTXMY_17645 [Glutamicibacter ardleyensis]|uniref:hypothetical protein n=1 Tax=Glutamicibacter ardleyensis TaxID=225894 RepID=UPI003FD61DF6
MASEAPENTEKIGWWDTRNIQRAIENEELQKAQDEGTIWCNLKDEQVICQATTEYGEVALELPLSQECIDKAPSFWDLAGWVKFQNDLKCTDAPKRALLAAVEGLEDSRN